MAITFLPNAMTSARESRGATQLQGWLSIAKQRALRDKAPRGVRLLPNPANALQLIKCQYIEQPDDFMMGTIQTALDPTSVPPNQPMPNTVLFTFPAGGDLLNGYIPLDLTPQPTWNVQAGDFLEIF